LLNRDLPGPPPEKAYRVDVLWEREVYSPSYENVLVEGQYCYLPARENNPDRRPNIVKINIEENGRVEWESRGVGYSRAGKPQKIGAHIYLSTYSGFIYVFNDSDGKLAATVMLGEDMGYCPTAVSGAYLFWGNDGLMRLNSERIDFSIAPDTAQNIAPEQIWSNESQAWIYANLVSEGGALYFLTRASENPSVLAAVDAETGGVIWEREAPHCQGYNNFSLVLNGEKLLIVESVVDDEGNMVGIFSSYLKSTGVPVLENSPMGNEAGSIPSVGIGIALYNNSLFYADRWGLHSVRADSGRLIWGISAWSFLPNLPANDQESMYFWSSPLVDSGKVFIMHGTGLRVYEADTGKFVGVDKSFQERWENEIAIYNDIYIFYNGSKGYVTAIRCK
jgi:outer membrane protein assembly factor BamB